MALSTVVPASFPTGVDATAVVPVGTIVRDDANGKEYIYLNGATSLAANDWVTYDSTYTATRSGANSFGMVAVAQAAVNTATKAGWFQTRGVVTGNIGATATANKSVYWHATAGTVSSTGVAGDLVVGAIVNTTGTSGTAVFMINNPTAYGSDNGYLT